MKIKRIGISLIVLIITIVIIIVIATAIIVTLSKTNVIDNANEATLKQDFNTLKDELNVYIADKFVEKNGDFQPENLNADSTTNPSVYEILPSLKSTKYKDNIIIVDGQLAFWGGNQLEKKVIDELNIEKVVSLKVNYVDESGNIISDPYEEKKIKSKLVTFVPPVIVRLYFK